MEKKNMPSWYPSDAELDAGVAQAVRTAQTGQTPCANCGAVSPMAGRVEGRAYCCVACAFHPLGCRCRFGEFGVEETQQFLGDED